MDMPQIIDKLGAVVQEIEAENGAPLPEYHPTTATGTKGYNHLIDALNRLPRPLMALMSLGFFVVAAISPGWFEARMQALSAIPEPLWWIVGAVITFFFGARETHYLRTSGPAKA